MSLTPEEVEEIRKTLCNFTVGKQDLCILLDPLIEGCASVSKTKDDLLACLKEANETATKIIKQKLK